MESLQTNILEPIRVFFENKTVTTVAIMLIALYAGLIAPALPNRVIIFFDTTVGRLLFIFLIAFVASRNVQIALMIAVAYVVTLYILNQRYAENFANGRLHEAFQAGMIEEDAEGKSIDTELTAAQEAQKMIDAKKKMDQAFMLEKPKNPLEVQVVSPAQVKLTAVKLAVCSWFTKLSAERKKQVEILQASAVMAIKDASDIAKNGTGITADDVVTMATHTEIKGKTVKQLCEEQRDVSAMLNASVSHEGFYNFEEVVPSESSSVSFSPAEFDKTRL